MGHTSSVSCLALVEDDDTDDIFFLSGGWDKYDRGPLIIFLYYLLFYRKIFAWNLRTCENINPYGDGVFRQLTDDAILSIDYNPQSKTFAYSTANNHIYIHSWSSDYKKISHLQTMKVGSKYYITVL